MLAGADDADRDRSPILRKLLAGAAGVAAAVILFLLGGDLMLEGLERQLIYFPTRTARDAPTPRLPGVAGVEEVWLESAGGLRVHGLYVTPDEDAFADLLFFHGNAGNLYDRLDNVVELARSGFRVLILDYRGYGKSDGRPSEPGLYADADAAFRHLVEERGVERDRLVVFGRSLGAAVAIDLAARERVGALIAESAFTGARAMAQLHYRWLPGVALDAMTHEFDSLSKVPGLEAPVLYVHGAADAIVPIEMGKELHDASPEPKAWYEIPGAGHNDTWAVGGRDYFSRLVEFARRHTADEEPPTSGR
jgi:fermentation-respiration switch protein FrsA (DUF1100 family)